MNVYLFKHAEFNRLYNCTFYDVDQIPLELRQHKILGVIIIFVTVIFEILYIPCIIAISKHLQNSAYKFMFYIGISDIVCMLINGLLTGFLAIYGDVYCSHPNIIYNLGGIALALWATETCSAMLLAINRCLEMFSPKLSYRLFHGILDTGKRNKTWAWILLPIIYAFIFFFFTKPLLFSGLYLSWFFNPHVGYYDDFGLIYKNDLHTVHNTFVFLGLTGIYLLFSILLIVKSMSFKNQVAHRSSSQKKSFIQVLLISIINATAAAVYVFMQFARISEALIFVGTFTWIGAHGMPSVIYITMNKTIRKDSRNILLNCIHSQAKRTTVTAITTDSICHKDIKKDSFVL